MNRIPTQRHSLFSDLANAIFGKVIIIVSWYVACHSEGYPLALLRNKETSSGGNKIVMDTMNFCDSFKYILSSIFFTFLKHHNSLFGTYRMYISKNKQQIIENLA